MKAKNWANALAPFGFFALTLQVHADVTLVGAPLQLEAGIYRSVVAQKTVPASGMKGGQLQIVTKPYHFVHLGDTIPSLPNAGLGFLVKFKSHKIGEMVTIQAHRIEDPGPTETWAIRVGDDGRFGVSRQPDPGFAPRTWKLPIYGLAWDRADIGL